MKREKREKFTEDKKREQKEARGAQFSHFSTKKFFVCYDFGQELKIRTNNSTNIKGKPFKKPEGCFLNALPPGETNNNKQHVR